MKKLQIFRKKIGFFFFNFFFQFFFQNFQFLFNIALNLTFGHIQPWISAAETEGRKLKTFVFGRKFRPLVYHWIIKFYRTYEKLLILTTFFFQWDANFYGLLWQWSGVLMLCLKKRAGFQPELRRSSENYHGQHSYNVGNRTPNFQKNFLIGSVRCPGRQNVVFIGRL